MKIMVAGPVGVGKTSLIYALKKINSAARKTQAIAFIGDAIDTPGEYAQIPRFYSALMVTSLEAEVVLLLSDAADPAVTLPPNFAGMFARPIVGVVTKIDLPCADPAKAESRLRQAGVTAEVFPVSTLSGEGIDALYQFLKERRCDL
ncbi:EutP/PduV family microcompartment system protein [Anaeroselena agilis]|uniref:EutP/PduV family microcompartment system protein n=1 Tax=Anaeroselena agilis TaxID=3063788 RepID=A0ABU3NS78_9FIRM|nr:EutP/PduV family microcompartment system protein [Selenomonadales bacterium 4137-cl]